jgi:D-alanyl-D-alanine carboxypeptidase (penicillin-binding protein 5/6)
MSFLTRILGMFIGACLAGMVVSSATYAAGFDTHPFEVRAASAVLGDIDSGVILYDQNADLRREPASLTKVMTLYLLFNALARKEITLDTEMSVSESAWRMGGSKTFVRVGRHVRVEDLIHGIAVQSGNDACVVVAEYLAGTEAGFADLMNQTAAKLGMRDTHYENASGLPGPQHYTTARDLLTLARAMILHFPQYVHYFQEKQYTFNGITQYNRNRLLWRDPNITGMKTGHTQAAGFCLIATNAKDGQRLAAVIMGADSFKNRENEALRMLHYGIRKFETVRLYEANTPIRALRVWKGAQKEVQGIVTEPVLVTLPRQDREKLEVGLSYEEPLSAPITTGQRLGEIQVKLANEVMFTRPVVAAQDVAEGSWTTRAMDGVRLRFGW